MLFLHINSGGKLLHIYCDKKQTNFKNWNKSKTQDFFLSILKRL